MGCPCSNRARQGEVFEPNIVKIIVEPKLTAKNFEAWHKVFTFIPSNEYRNIRLA